MLSSLTRGGRVLLGSPASASRLYSLSSSYETIVVDPAKGKGVALITLNRPKALNALCDQMLLDLIHATGSLDANDSVGAIVITGSQKAFAAGADIKEMSSKSFADVFSKNMFSNWAKISKVRKPTIAAIVRFSSSQQHNNRKHKSLLPSP